jgi:hypothetical protein
MDALDKWFAELMTNHEMPDLEDLLPRRPEWQRYAACRNLGVDPWFPPGPKTSPTGLDLCFQCPVRRACLDYALSLNDNPVGVGRDDRAGAAGDEAGRERVSPCPSFCPTTRD